MRKLVIILTFISFCIMGVNNIFSQPDYEGDLALEVNITSPCTITITMELSSIPFEGRHNPIPGGNNRIGEIYNGSVYRLFNQYNVQEEYQINYHSRTQYGGTMIFDLGSCNELPDPVDGGWGYARYKITYFLDYVSKPPETYVLYFNALDSKYGKLNYPPPSQTNYEWIRYSADWHIVYEESEKRIYIKGTHYGPPGFPSFNNHVFGFMDLGQQPEPEFKVWKMLGSIDGGNGWNSPWEENFYAHSTPFPVSKITAEQFPRVFTLGTKVNLGQVYENTGYYDIHGYNTQNIPYYTNPPISGNNEIGNTFVTPATYFIHNGQAYFGIKIIAEDGDRMTLEENKKLWISGTNTSDGGDTIHFKQGSTLEMKSNSKLASCYYGVIINEGANVIWNNQAHHWISLNSELCYIGDNTVNNGGYIEIENGGKLILDDNTILTFDGSNSYLKLNPNAQVKLGSNAKIEFKNGAYINANNVTFSGIGSSPWEGLYFENAGAQTVIGGCTFNNVKNPIRIINTNTTAMGYNKQIVGNVFNVHQDGNNGVYAKNVFNILVNGNTFNIPSATNIQGLYINNSYASGNTHLNIINNTFYGGYCSILLNNLATNITSYYIYKNTFHPAVNSNIIGLKIFGDIKENNFLQGGTHTNVILSQSNPNLYRNNMNTGYINLRLVSSSTPHLSPYVQTDDNLSWTGGGNSLNSQNNDNIQINTGYVYTDFGNNHFTSNHYHLYGMSLETNSNTYKTWNNCWYQGGHANGLLTNNVNYTQPMIIDDYKTPDFYCPYFNTPINITITDKGYGIYDTTIITEGYSGTTLLEDERIYYLALQKKDLEMYLDAIVTYKFYIDTHHVSQFINTSLYELFECHEMLDTSDNQEYREVLYGELRNYLDAKILSGLYDPEFEDIAYNLILMCEANMDNLEISLDGYEFIALFHPDPEARLIASWDYLAIDDLIDSGSSGGITEKIIKMDKQRRLKKFEKLIDSDPLMKKFRDKYRVQEKKIKKNTEKVIRSRTRDDRSANEKIKRAKERDQKLKTRASTNLTILRHLSGKEREKLLLEDITLICGNKYGENDNNQTNKIIPDNYSLSQNYPNPFNPTTSINYELPKDETVKLIVYDILGREVSKLVNNEFKTAGRYSVVFDGSNLSSGIYFYKIEAGSFTDIKRMVLIK